MATAVKPRIKLDKKEAKKGDIVEVKALVAHIMETGQRKDAQGNTIPRKILKKFACTVAGKQVFAADFEPAVSANPYIQFKFKAAESGPVVLTWTDDDGSHDRRRRDDHRHLTQSRAVAPRTAPGRRRHRSDHPERLDARARAAAADASRAAGVRAARQCHAAARHRRARATDAGAFPRAVGQSSASARRRGSRRTSPARTS